MSDPSPRSSDSAENDVLRFRTNVAAILQHEDGKIFVAERSDVAGAWQFPQGGVDKGESLRAALARELEEEISVGPDLYEITEEKGGYRYVFPDGHVKWKYFRGQEQTYFLCRFHGADGNIRLDTAHPEFARYRWIEPGEFDLAWVPDFKKDVYRQVLADFFGVDV